MIISTLDALKSLAPDAEWVLTDDQITFWSSDQAQPTEEELAAEVARLTAEQPRKEAEANRASAYATEADPLFFKAQRGEATMDEWNAKVAEIRARYPYGGES